MKFTPSKRILKRATLGVAILGITGGALFYASQSASANDPNTSATQLTDKQETEATSTALQTIQMANIAFTQINDAIANNTVLSQDKLDELTYYMYQYAQANYSFASQDNKTISTADQGFDQLNELYKKANLDTPFAKVTANDGSISYTFNRTIKKPASWNTNIKKTDTIASKAAEQLTDSDSKSKEVKITDNNVTVKTGG